MRFLQLGVLCLLLCAFAAAQTNRDLYSLKSRYSLGEKSGGIVQSVPLDDGNRFLLIGRKENQLYDVPGANLVNSYSHNIDGFMGSLWHHLSWFPEQIKVSPDGAHGIVLKKGMPGITTSKIRAAVIWNMQTGERSAVLTRNESVRSAVFSTDGTTIMSVHGDLKNAEVAFWDAKTFELRTTLRVKDLGYHAMSPDGQRVYIGSAKANKMLGLWVDNFDPINGIGVWNTRTGKIEKTFTDGDIKYKHELDFGPVLSPDGRFLAAGSEGNKIVLWDTAGDGKAKFIIMESDPRNVLRVTKFSEDSKYLLAVRRGDAEMWEAETGKLYRKFSLVPAGLRDSSYYFKGSGSILNDLYYWLTPDMKYAIRKTTGSFGVYDLVNQKDLYDMNLETIRYEHKDKHDEEESLEVMRVSPDSKTLIVYGGKSVRVHDLVTGEEIQRLFDPQRAEYSKEGKLKDSGLDNKFAGWLADGRTIYVYGEDKRSFYLWNKD